jgi:hypothetical protein
MKKVMLTAAEVGELIKTGRFLALAADEQTLERLPRGNWIAGTIPYFVGEAGGMQSRELIHVTDLSAADSGARIVDYTLDTIPGIANDAPNNGYTVLILPALSAIHSDYARNARDYEGLFMKPIIGWISGVHLDDLGKVTPKVFNGQTGTASDSQAVAIHMPVADDLLPVIRILNLFRQGEGDVLTFPEDGFSASACWVNGQPANFAEYVTKNGLDLSRPLVADYHGAQINTSFQGIDAEHGVVNFYAPVFAGIEYKQAAPVGDYVHEFEALTADIHVQSHFACNCILNFLYGKLEGRQTGELTGPMTFGEIGYQLLNQTQVYLEILEN